MINVNSPNGNPAPRSRATPAVPRPTPRSAKKPSGVDKTGPNTAPARGRTSDAVDLLVDDHLAVHACFKRYDKLAEDDAGAADRKTLAEVICRMLTTHMTIEEEILYPAARSAGIDAALIDEADVEHASAKVLIAEIREGDPKSDHYDAKVKVLGEYIDHHIVEEHTEMFPKCRKASMDLVRLRERMQARKEDLEAAG